MEEVGTNTSKMKNYIRLSTILIIYLIIAFPVMAKEKVVVVIDPGHGGYSDDASAYGAIYKDELCEKDINLATALTIKEELEQYNNVEVYLTRDTDAVLTLDERVDFAYRMGADVLISCHYNASESHLFYGSEIFTSAFGSCYTTGHALATCIMDQWVNDGQASKGIKTRIGKTGEDYYGIIRHGFEVGLPVIIIEHGYLDNHIDYERLGMPEDWERMGRLDATGIAEYYGLSRERVWDNVIPTVITEMPDGRVDPDTTPPGSVSMNIIDCNIETSEVTYEITAREYESKLMYYGIALGDPEDEDADPSDYADLILWEEGCNKVTGTYSVPTGYRGPITARVYNNYELYTDSETQQIDFASLLEERAALLEQAAQEARMKAEERKQAAERRAEAARIEAEQKKEREKVGDFFFFMGGNEKEETIDPATRKKRLYLEIIALVVFIVVFISLIIIRHRREIIKYIRNIEGNDLDT
ncbi:MAG: N-acetylmuramoyl-L-alanine amidase [Lachnospiraceae bacterium]|nr:N-acetylmuramoyl-L-alanine amidase [Lachnospiraceae bacterium]